MKRLSNLSISSIALLALLLPMLVACGMLEVGIEPPATPRDEVTMRATQEEAAGIHVVVAETSTRTVSGLAPMPTSVLDGSHLTFNDPALGLALDIPLWWELQSTPGAVAHFYQQVPGGTRQTVLTISVLKPESNTLELALDELTQGTWGPYIQAVQSTPLGTFEALRLELEFAADRPPVIWLVVAPSGRAVSIVPDVDPSWIEPVIEVVLDTLHPIPITSRAVSTATLTPPAAETGAKTPYCRPSEASIDLSASARTLKVGQTVTVTVNLANGDTSGVRLGQIQYTLGVKPPGIFSSNDWGPVESTLTLEPGQSDVVQFVLRAETPGPATLDGLASYEIHAMDFSWGSWSGCYSWPLEMSVTP